LTGAEPRGIVTEFHVAPPLVVTISNAVALGSISPNGFGPTAVQVLAYEHDTDRKTLVPPSTNRGSHDSPPSVLTRICDPTATQNIDVGQATDPSAPRWVGRVGVVQDEPPFEETRSSPR